MSKSKAEPELKTRCAQMVIDKHTGRERRCKHTFIANDPKIIYCYHHNPNRKSNYRAEQEGTYQQEDYARIHQQHRVEKVDEYHKLKRFIIHFSEYPVHPAIYYEDGNKIKVDIPSLLNQQFFDALNNLTLNELRSHLKMRDIAFPFYLGRATKENYMKTAFSSKFTIKSLLNPGVNGLPDWGSLNLFEPFESKIHAYLKDKTAGMSEEEYNEAYQELWAAHFKKWCTDNQCEQKIEFEVDKITTPKLHIEIETAVNQFDLSKLTISKTPLYFILSGGGHAHILFLVNGKFYNMGLGSSGSKGKLLAFSPDIADYMTEHMQIVDIGILNREHLKGINEILGKTSSVRFDIGRSVSQSLTISNLYYNLCSRTGTATAGELLYKVGEMLPLPLRKATRVCSKMTLNCTTFLTRIFKNINCDEHLVDELAEVKKPLGVLKRVATILPESFASPAWCTRAKTRAGTDNLLTADVLDTIFRIIFVNDNEKFKQLIATGVITNESAIDWRVEFPEAKFHPTGFSAAHMI
jgi:hypothetical protein